MKKLWACILAVCLVFALSACVDGAKSTAEGSSAAGGSSSAVGASSPQDTSDDEPLVAETVFWTDSQPLEPGLQAAVDAFMADNPNYTITIEAFPGSERPEKLALAKQGGTLPGLFLTAYFTSADEVHQGSIASVGDIIDGYYKDDVSPEILSQVMAGDDYYMVPIFSSSQGLLFNADIFKAAGLEEFVPEDPNEIALWTLEDLDTKILPALKSHFAGTEKYPLTLYAANAQNDSFQHTLLRMYGGEIFEDGVCIAGNDENTVKAFEKLKEWTDKGYTNADVITRLWTDCNADFRNQNAGISAGQFQSYLNHLAAFKDGSAEAFDVRVAAVPRQMPNGTDTGAMHTYVYGFSMMNVDEDQKTLARDFLIWLSQNRDSMIDIINGVPASNTLIEKLKGENPLYASYQDADKYLFDFTGGAPGWVATRDVFYPAFQSYFSGAQDAKTALTEYMNKANAIIADYTQNSLVLN